MNKSKLIIFIFFFIVIFCIVGSFFLQGDIEIESEVDIIDLQNKITSDINIYGYTIDNPNVIVNPYGENYNTALIIFETDDYVSINVNVNDIYSYNSNFTNKHYIGVYNLIEGKNYVNLSYGEVNKKIEINIDKGNGMNIDDMILIANNHFIIPTYKHISEDVYTGFREVDIFGKVYYEYILEDGYYGISCEIDDEYVAVLSENLLIVDRQNGEIIKNYDISDYGNNWIAMEYLDNSIILYGKEKNISISFDGEISLYEGMYVKKYLSSDVNYINKRGVRFYKEVKTKTSDENIWLLGYSNDIDFDINIKKEFNRIVINSEDLNECDNYLILDKLFDKRVYELCDNTTYVYTYDFEGEYSIYFKVNGKIYKTDKYLKF